MLTASFPGWRASLIRSEEEAEAASAEMFPVNPSSLQWFHLSAYMGIPLPHSKTQGFPLIKGSLWPSLVHSSYTVLVMRSFLTLPETQSPPPTGMVSP